eukprot:CAMPEP_0115858076 /NCGR_PEP_ID=MMETSP0287-20121206/15910_1 /TAXON_ID=412157 /ORGANISM="Chrysochromulina rotalis, Strain UIO044" /LENGTH=62 /DNA_ID=CAMNT_0003312327 /DNA_START=258 /DNA_END=446 /DNA_ORIENTATION=+
MARRKRVSLSPALRIIPDAAAELAEAVSPRSFVWVAGDGAADELAAAEFRRAAGLAGLMAPW